MAGKQRHQHRRRPHGAPPAGGAAEIRAATADRAPSRPHARHFSTPGATRAIAGRTACWLGQPVSRSPPAAGHARPVMPRRLCAHASAMRPGGPARRRPPERAQGRVRPRSVPGHRRSGAGDARAGLFFRCGLWRGELHPAVTLTAMTRFPAGIPPLDEMAARDAGIVAGRQSRPKGRTAPRRDDARRGVSASTMSERQRDDAGGDRKLAAREGASPAGRLPAPARPRLRIKSGALARPMPEAVPVTMATRSSGAWCPPLFWRHETTRPPGATGAQRPMATIASSLAARSRAMAAGPRAAPSRRAPIGGPRSARARRPCARRPAPPCPVQIGPPGCAVRAAPAWLEAEAAEQPGQVVARRRRGVRQRRAAISEGGPDGDRPAPDRSGRAPAARRADRRALRGGGSRTKAVGRRVEHALHAGDG